MIALGICLIILGLFSILDGLFDFIVQLGCGLVILFAILALIGSCAEMLN